MWVLLPVCLAILFYLLYQNGFLPVKSASALVFIGSLSGRDRCGADFTACSGTVRRKIKFRKAGTYRFTLDARIEKGSFQAMVLDQAGLPVMTLNDGCKTASLCADAGSRYTLLLNFTSASGSFSMQWRTE